MKKQILIGLSVLLFIFLFYKQGLGINVAVFAIALLGFTVNKFPAIYQSARGKFLISAVVLTSFSFAWLPDFSSFFALMVSLTLLRMYAEDARLNWMFAPAVFIVNSFSVIYRVFLRNLWIEGDFKVKNQYALKLLMYMVIPLIFISGFVVIYTSNSDYLSHIVSSVHWEFDVWSLLVYVVLGICISFVYWDCWILETIKSNNSKWKPTFDRGSKDKIQNMFSSVDLDLERRSGEITLLLLNVFLAVFLVFYNYEQFFDPFVEGNLSAQTHQRVNSLILSIVMAIGLLLLYFKGGFNFDVKAKRLRRLAFTWIVLNTIMVVSTCIKNLEYVVAWGLTYKRLGVFVFLMLCVIGLLFTYSKIKDKKTNFYLVDRMCIVFFVCLLVCGVFNWSALITRYNLMTDKIDWNYLKEIDSGNEFLLLDYAQQKNIDTGQYGIDIKNLIYSVTQQQRKDVRSMGLYYQTVDLVTTYREPINADIDQEESSAVTDDRPIE
ncbi:DUF4173 domain-containing protein [Flavobacterium sp. NKUCC04_CG]|uniref:DUF4153 domain-containing protein n=1 Tax=Flavobacterium sp. NKUCC04_CG TaxID=2842121 RepID=UPI001C5BA3ED|nr:DUF4173 domain-containing protein [Flavobacterium sp. NKUCC04_CG]MBW3519783.1 DUF4173 domain-containing protein [Flavobacterium sp. NKUCC04_CG]